MHVFACIIIALEQLISKQLPGESTQIFAIHVLRVYTCSEGCTYYLVVLLQDGNTS